MIVKHTTKTNEKNFEDIRVGDCFIAVDGFGDECTYMKIATVTHVEGDILNAVDLDFGTLTTFKNDDEVEKVDAIVTIERYGN